MLFDIKRLKILQISARRYLYAADFKGKIAAEKPFLNVHNKKSHFNIQKNGLTT